MGVAGLGVARSYLIQQADSQLRTYAEGLVTGVITIMPNGGLAAGGPGRGLAPGPFGENAPGVEVLGPGGAMLTPSGQRPIPASLARLLWGSGRGGTPVSVAAGSGHTAWRVIAERIHYRARHIPFVYGPQDTSLSLTSPAHPGLPGVLVVGVNPGRDATLGGITAAVLVVAAVVILLAGWAVVMLTRVRLRPLAQIEQTAAAIASGEPWRPVPSRAAGGDAGRLARSLNTALAQAERSLGTSAASAAASRQSEELMRQAVTDACLQARTPLRVIHGLAVSWRQRGAVPPDELDRMMKRVDEEAARIGRLADDLAHQGKPAWRAPPRP